MEKIVDYFFENTVFIRYISFILLILVAVITHLFKELNSLYILITILLSIGYFSKSKWILVFFSSTVVAIRTSVNEDEHLMSYLVRTLIYTSVALIAAEVTKQFKENIDTKNEFIFSLSKLLDTRDTYTANHSENVANCALIIAKEMGLSKKQCDNIYIGGLLHDIGKIGIPNNILIKPSKLTPEEYEVIKQHSLIGYDSIKMISWYKKTGISEMVLYHHERFDGTGYPFGLKGEDIPLSARIITIADSFDAMTSSRVYRKNIDLDYTLAEIKKNRGKQFDPKIAEIFLNIIERDGIDIFLPKREPQQYNPQIMPYVSGISICESEEQLTTD